MVIIPMVFGSHKAYSDCTDNRLYFDTIFKRVSTTMDINLFLALTLTDIV